MLAIRLQRTGRSGHTQFRVIVQDSHFSPTRGRVVAYLGNYDPHTKLATINGVKASQYLENGAQPSDRVARLLQKEGVKLPNWVKLDQPQERSTRHPDKRRSTRPAEPKAPEAEAPAEEVPVEETPAAEPAAESPSEDTPTEADATPSDEPATEEAPAEDTAADDKTKEPEAVSEPAEEDKPAEDQAA
jgi:small subunit ribosomal protein S16